MYWLHGTDMLPTLEDVASRGDGSESMCPEETVSSR
jgi:hypothetical protein